MARDDRSPAPDSLTSTVQRPPLPAVSGRLAYLLKHARERLAALNAEALGPLGITGRELAVLTVVAEGRPPSQFEAARRLSIDRTSMVALVDGLEAKGLVERRTDPADRRRNVVGLTEAGRQTLAAGSEAAEDAETRFLARLSEADRDRLRSMLRTLALSDGPGTSEEPR